MSWGERSCKYLYAQDKQCKPSLEHCNVNCALYEWDGIRQPDSLTYVEQIRKDIAENKLEQTAIVCKRNKWDKKKGNKIIYQSERIK